MNNNLQPINTIPNFKRFCMTIGELPTSYLETMTYYEMLVWFTEYMKNTIIPTINNNGLAVKELQDKYIELKNYVDNYFTNLDVQQEINNKLDAMAESGELTNLIKNYVDPIYEAFENEINNDISNFKDSTNLAINNQNNEISSFKKLINGQVQHIDEKVTNATSGSPKGVYATLQDLTSANPDHNYIYVVSDNGYWYYYDSSLGTWASGGVYQASSFPEVTDIRDAYYDYTYDTAGDSVRSQCKILNEKINDNMNYKGNIINYFNPKNIVEGYWINNVNKPSVIEPLNYMIYNFVEIDRPGYYCFKWPNQSIGANSYKTSLYDKAKNYIGPTNATLVGNVDGNNTIVKLLITDEMFYKNDVRYLGYNQALSNMYNLMFVYGETYPDTYIDYNAYKYSNSLYNK